MSRRSTAGVSGRRSPSSIPTVTPFAPGNSPNMLSKVRFSLITKTTCLIGVAVSIASAFTAAGASPYSSGGNGVHPGASSPHELPSSADTNTTADKRRSVLGIGR